LNVNNGQVERDEFISYVSRAPTFVRYFQYWSKNIRLLF
jgi:hypothetical protein